MFSSEPGVIELASPMCSGDAGQFTAGRPLCGVGFLGSYRLLGSSGTSASRWMTLWRYRNRPKSR